MQAKIGRGKIGRGWVPLILLFTLGMSSSPMLPIWLAGATAQFGLSAAQGGLIASLELASLALGSIAWAATSGSADRKAGLLVAVAISVAANLLSFLARDAMVLTAARVVAGAVLGVTLAEITGRAATLPDAQKVFARQQLGLILFIATFFTTIPFVIAATRPFAPFLYPAAIGLVALPASAWLPERSMAAAALVAGPASAARRPGLIALALAAIAATYMVQSAVWAYIPAAAGGVGLDLARMGQILAAGAFLNLLAPLALERLGARTDRRVLLTVGFIAMSASALLITLGLGKIPFMAGATGLNFALMFLTPMLLGLLADLDHTGRTAAAGPAFFTIGGAFGPVLGGVIIAAMGMTVLGQVLAAVLILALALAWSAATGAGSSAVPARSA